MFNYLSKWISQEQFRNFTTQNVFRDFVVIYGQQDKPHLAVKLEIRNMELDEIKDYAKNYGWHLLYMDDLAPTPEKGIFWNHPQKNCFLIFISPFLTSGYFRTRIYV